MSDAIDARLDEAQFCAQVNAQRGNLYRNIIPDNIREVWAAKFSKSQLRGFLSFCLRRPISKWLKYLKNELQKKNSVWTEEAKPETESLRKALNSWATGDEVDAIWKNAGNELETLPSDLGDRAVLRIAREAVNDAIRGSLRRKDERA